MTWHKAGWIQQLFNCVKQSLLIVLIVLIFTCTHTRSSMAVTNNINEGSIYVHNHETPVSKDCVNPVCEHCWSPGRKQYGFLFGLCSSLGNKSNFWTSSSKRPFMENIQGSIFMFIPTPIWGDISMDFGKKDPNDVNTNSPENSFQPHLLLEVICKLPCSCMYVWWSSPSFSLSAGTLWFFLTFNHNYCNLSKGTSKGLSTEDIE